MGGEVDAGPAHTAQMDCRIVLVDPFHDQDLFELVQLAGAPVKPVHAWPFDLRPEDRVLSTIPVPLAATDRVLGVLVGAPTVPGIGEAWPRRVVSLEQGREDILALVGGAEQPRGRVVAVLGLSGGIGATTLAAALARRAAGVPLAVALMDLDPTPALERLLGLRVQGGARIADFAGERGPLLPERCAARLPVWNRVRVAASDGRGHGGASLVLAQALARAHDLLVLDIPRGLLAAGNGAGEVLAGLCDDAVMVRSGRPGERAAIEGLRPQLGAARVHQVLRAGRLPAEALHGGVVRLGHERIGADVEHGVQPGDRPRGAVMSAAAGLAVRLGLAQ